MLIQHPNDGIMIPIPQYPIYSAYIELNGGTQVNYYLNEEKNWALDLNELDRSIHDAKLKGVKVKSLAVINPGNPTGQVLTRSNIEDLITFCYKHNLAILADEVYQENIYVDKEFHSVKKVLMSMGEPFSNSIELMSFHSVSKGLQGDCGLRGGYVEFWNLDKYAEEISYKMKSVNLCSSTPGMIALALMVNPPKKGRETDAIVSLHEAEKEEIFSGLKEKAEMLTRKLDAIEGITCTTVEGAMYAFPKLHFPKRALQEAHDLGQAPDSLFCIDMLNKTGIMTVPGSGFGQAHDSWHFRLTNLISDSKEMSDSLDRIETFTNEYFAKYQ